MAYTFLKAQGFEIGTSLVEEDRLAMARDLLSKAEQRVSSSCLPSDHLVAETFAADSPTIVGRKHRFPTERHGA